MFKYDVWYYYLDIGYYFLSWVKKDVDTCAQLTFQMLTLQTKLSIPPEPVVRNMRKGPAPVAQMIRTFGMNEEIWVGVHLGPRHFRSHNVDTFKRASVCEMNAVACAQFIFQMFIWHINHALADLAAKLLLKLKLGHGWVATSRR